MIGDKIIITKKERDRAKIILPKLLQLSIKSIITIGGGSGSRKTELAVCLQEELYNNNKRTIVVSLDDYYNTHFKDRIRIRKRRGLKYIGLKEIEWSYLKEIIKHFKLGKNINTQIINKYTEDYNEETIYGVSKVDYLIIEGLYANYLKKYKLSDFCIHLDGTPKQTLPFRKRRKKEDEDSNFRQQIVQKEFKIVTQLKKYADIVLEF